MPPGDRDERDLADLRAGRPADAADPMLQRLGEVARSLREDDSDLAAPRPEVWAAIAARAGQPPPETVEATEATEAHEATEARRARRGRSPRGWVLAVAAAAVVALAVAGGLVAAGRGDDPEVLASAVLEPLTDVTEPAGEARLVDAGDGQRLDITFDGELPSAAGFYEVWLIDRQVDGMVSLGPVRADGSYDVPAGVDVERFPVVDVSVEPTDGDPAHSGASVLRGTLA